MNLSSSSQDGPALSRDVKLNLGQTSKLGDTCGGAFQDKNTANRAYLVIVLDMVKHASSVKMALDFHGKKH